MISFPIKQTPKPLPLIYPRTIIKRSKINKYTRIYIQRMKVLLSPLNNSRPKSERHNPIVRNAFARRHNQKHKELYNQEVKV